MKQTGKDSAAIATAAVRLSLAAEWQLLRQAVKTVHPKRLGPNFRRIQERVHNSQTELAFSQCILHSQLPDAEVSNLPGT